MLSKCESKSHTNFSIAAEKPFLSNIETRMTALREACTVLQWSEKELRNKL
jgi:hypothetical protein